MRWAGLFVAMVLVAGCGPRPQSCRTSADCPESSTCERYFCISNESTTETYDGGLHLITEEDGGEEPIDGGVLPADGGEEPDEGGDVDVDAGPGTITCTAHAQCEAPLKCRGHVCR